MGSEIIKDLSREIDSEAVQRTDKLQTKKGYDTTGYAYQYLVDRFNLVCDEKWGYYWEIVKDVTGQYRNGTGYFEVTVNVSIWVGEKTNARTMPGGHTSVGYADALKGAVTNGFKKAAAMWGVGASAYRGTIDDDNKPLPEQEEEKTARPISEPRPVSETTTPPIDPKLEAARKKLNNVHKEMKASKKYNDSEIAQKMSEAMKDKDNIEALELYAISWADDLKARKNG